MLTATTKGPKIIFSMTNHFRPFLLLSPSKRYTEKRSYCSPWCQSSRRGRQYPAFLCCLPSRASHNCLKMFRRRFGTGSAFCERRWEQGWGSTILPKISSQQQGFIPSAVPPWNAKGMVCWQAKWRLRWLLPGTLTMGLIVCGEKGLNVSR